MLLDIHTHYPALVSGESIQNVDPVTFSPVKSNYYSVGIHPWKVTGEWERDWERLLETVHHPAVLALGEAGLDKLSSVDFTLQKTVFERQILLSEEIEKPLVIHCVKAFNELIEFKRKYKPQMPWIVHGFRNNLNIAYQLLREDIYFSIGEKYQDNVVLEIPVERLLTETDESAVEIHDIIDGIADLRGVSSSELCHRIDENARKIFFQ